MTAPKPGIYEAIPYEDYAAWPCVNWSWLRKMALTPFDFHWAETHPQPEEDHFAFGRLFHSVLLEPESVKARYAMTPAVYPKVAKVGGADIAIKAVDNSGSFFCLASGRGAKRLECKVAVVERDGAFRLVSKGGDESLFVQAQVETATWTGAANFCAHWAELQRASGREIVETEAMQKALAMAANLAELSDVKLTLGGSRRELSLVWTDPQTELLCKARLDVEHNGVLADAKSTGKSADWESFSKSLFYFGYAGQAAFYLDGFKHAGGVLPELPYFRFLVAETEAPWKPAVYDLYDSDDYGSGAWLRHGRQLAAGYLQRVAYHRKLGFWPGHNPGPDGETAAMELEVPEYLQGKVYA